MRTPRPARSALFTILLLAAGVLALLPARYTRWLRSPFQILALPQWAALRFAQRVGDGAGGAPDDGLTRLEQENARLKQALGQQRLWLEDLERRYDAVCGLRGQMWSDRVELVIARVVGFDSSPWRQTVLIGRGADSKLEPGQWVAAGAGFDDWRSGAEFLLQRCIIGRVSEVQTHSARVELVTDPKFREQVAPVKVLADGTWQVDPRRDVIAGGGKQRMVIREADADLYKLGFTYVAVPAGTRLPATLSLGRITSSKQSAQSALHFDVEVEPLVDPARLQWVAVVVVPS